MMNGDDKLSTLQMGRGQKQSHEGTSNNDHDHDETFYDRECKSSEYQKFKTTGMNNRVQFTNALANAKLTKRYSSRINFR